MIKYVFLSTTLLELNKSKYFKCYKCTNNLT